MNTLSWLIYLADLVSGLGLFLALAGAGALTFGILGYTHIIVDCDGEDDGTKSYAKPAFFSGLFALFLCAILPSKEGMYAIAVSEMGEEVIKSETAGKAVQALNAWLDKQVGGQSK